MKEREGKGKKKERYFLPLFNYCFILKCPSFFCSCGSSDKQGWCIFLMATSVVFFPPPFHTVKGEKKKPIAFPGSHKTASKTWHNYMHSINI